MQQFRRFIPSSDDLGSEALQYVISEDHTAGIPLDALRMAEHAAIVAVARLETTDPVLARLNRAIDLIAAGIRYAIRFDAERRAKLDQLLASSPVAPAAGHDGGAKVPAGDPIPRRPSPSGAMPIGRPAPPLINPF